jgi:hypothetical protein
MDEHGKQGGTPVFRIWLYGTSADVQEMAALLKEWDTVSSTTP